MAATFFNDRQSVLFSSTALCNSYGFEFCLPFVFFLMQFRPVLSLPSACVIENKIQFRRLHLFVFYRNVEQICTDDHQRPRISRVNEQFLTSHSDLRISFCWFGFSRRRMRAHALLVVWSSRIRSNQADSDPSGSLVSGAWVEVPVWVFVGERCVCCWLSTIFRRRIAEENSVAEPELSDEQLSWSRSSSFALWVDRRFLVPRW